jgi:hypothetical protein
MEEKSLTPQEQNREWAEEAFWTGHCHYLLQALALAASRCQVWRLAETGDVFTLLEMFNFAKKYDEEHPLKDGEFFRTTVDVSAKEQETVCVSAGKIGYQVELAPADLEKMIRLTYADITV